MRVLKKNFQRVKFPQEEKQCHLLHQKLLKEISTTMLKQRRNLQKNWRPTVTDPNKEVIKFI